MNFRAKHFLITLLAAVAMIVATVPACACSHHQPKIEVKANTTSCHFHAEESATDQDNAAKSIAFCSTGDCICITPQTAAAEKSSSISIKVKKSVAIPVVEMVIATVAIPHADHSTEFALAPTFTSDTSYNIPHDRGPPRL